MTEIPENTGRENYSVRRPSGEESCDTAQRLVSHSAHGRRPVARVTTEEHWELVRAELLPLYIERRTLAEIAHAFGVSSNTAGAWRNRLIDELRNEATTLHPRDYVMESITSLRVARADAWRTVRESSTSKERRAGLQLVVQIENQSTKLGAAIGLYGRAGDLPLQQASVDEIDDGARQLRAMLLEFLGGPDGEAVASLLD